MSSASGKDLETMLGDPRKALLSMAGPLIVSYLIIQLNTFMDLSWCSGLGSACTSAVASISPMAWIASGLGTGIGVGAAAAIATRLGTGDKDKADSLASQTIVISVVLALVTTVILLLLIDPIVDMMGVTDIREECHEYITPMILGAVLVVLNGTVAGMLRGEGAAKRSTYVLIVAALTHMALDPLFIYGLDMGLTGAAIATVIGMGTGAALGLYWYFAGRTVVGLSFGGYRPKRDEISYILGVGIPRAFEIFIVSIMSMVQRIFVVECGGTEAAMFYNIPWNFVTLAQSISMSLGSALVPISAAAIAMGLTSKSESAFGMAMKWTLVSMTALAAVLFVFADVAMLPFTYSSGMSEYREEFVHVMRIYMLIVPCMGAIDVASSMLQSMRRAQQSMISSFIRNFLIVIALVWACTVSLDAIYWSLVVCEYIGAALMVGLAVRGTRLMRKAHRQLS